MIPAVSAPRSLDGSTPKHFRDGTHRLMCPLETVQRVRPFMPVMGITRVANITGLDRIGIQVVVVCRPNSRSLAVSQGKGLDLFAAKASALMESVEAYHAERIVQPLILSSYEELCYTHPLVDIFALPRPRASVFHPTLPLLWAQGWDLLQREPVWVPYETVHTNYTLPQPTGGGCFSATSNGLASGNHILEAISHGICEVVERDASSMWNTRSAGAQQASRIVLRTVKDVNVRVVHARYDRDDVNVAVGDTTSDVGIPSFMCLIVERTQSVFQTLYSAAGMGCHPVREVALLRALTEAAQGRLTAISGSRDDIMREQYEHSFSPEVLERDQRLMNTVQGTRAFHEVPTFEGETFEEDVSWELSQLQRAGINRVIVVDLTRAEFQLPVARVVIPGLEGVSQLPCYVLCARAFGIATAPT